MVSAFERAVISSVSPGLVSLADELRRDLIVETPIETGELKSNVYASVDDVSGEIEVGYDESDSDKPHGFYIEFGTSRQAAQSPIRKTVYRRRRSR